LNLLNLFNMSNTTENNPTETTPQTTPATPATPNSEQLSAAEWMIQELHRRMQQSLSGTAPLSPAPEKN
jgi:hypothetical protein